MATAVPWIFCAVVVAIFVGVPQFLATSNQKKLVVAQEEEKNKYIQLFTNIGEYLESQGLGLMFKLTSTGEFEGETAEMPCGAYISFESYHGFGYIADIKLNLGEAEGKWRRHYLHERIGNYVSSSVVPTIGRFDLRSRDGLGELFHTKLVQYQALWDEAQKRNLDSKALAIRASYDNGKSELDSDFKRLYEDLLPPPPAKVEPAA